MGKPLILLQGLDGDQELLERAIDLYEGRNTELVIAKLLDEGEFRSTVERGARRGADSPDIEELSSKAKQDIQELMETVLERGDITYTSVGEVAKLPDRVYEVANEQGCDHLFVQTEKRSPTGKAVFGDLAQTLILNFTGLTSVYVVDE